MDKQTFSVATRPAGLAGAIAVLHVLVLIVVSFGCILIVRDPKFAAYALWTYSDTSQLQTKAELAFLFVTVAWLIWIPVSSRVNRNRFVPPTVLALLALSALGTAIGDVHPTEYVHRVPAVWSLMMAWVIGASAAVALIAAYYWVKGGRSRVG